MNKIYLDFETYYDTEVSLSKITTLQYVHHPDFKIWGVGVKLNDEPTEWYGFEPQMVNCHGPGFVSKYSCKKKTDQRWIW